MPEVSSELERAFLLLQNFPRLRRTRTGEGDQGRVGVQTRQVSRQCVYGLPWQATEYMLSLRVCCPAAACGKA